MTFKKPVNNKSKTRIRVTGIAAFSCASLLSYYFLTDNTIAYDEVKQTAKDLHTSSYSAPPSLKASNSSLESRQDTLRNKTIKSDNSDSVLEEDVLVSDLGLTTKSYEEASRYGALPAHMTDLRLESFALDSQGKLIINENIKHIIEFFLMGAHIEGKEQSIARIMEYITLSLPSSEVGKATLIAENYLRYKNQTDAPPLVMNEGFSKEENLANLKAALDSKKSQRRQYLGEELSNALFAQEESYDNYSFQRMVINSDPGLSDMEKDQQLAQAEQYLPPKLARSMRYKREERKLSQEIKELKQSAGTEAEVYQLRKEFYGEKVAERMGYLESNSDHWQARVSDFYLQQQNIFALDSLSNEEKKQAIKDLKNGSFSQKEQIKLAVQAIRSSVASRN